MDPPSTWCCCCRASLLWIVPTYLRAFRKGCVSLEDIPLLDPGTLPFDQATALLPGGYRRLLTHTGGLQFWRTVWYLILRDWHYFLLLGLSQGMCQAALACVPLVLELLLDALQALAAAAPGTSAAASALRACLWLLLALLALFTTNALFFPPSMYLKALLTQRSTAVLLGALALKAPLIAQGSRSPGEAQTALSKGAAALGPLFPALHAATWAPAASCALGAYRLTALLGAPAACSALLLMAAALGSFTSLRLCMKRFTAASTDVAAQRYGALGEALGSAAAVKALGWEGVFLRRIGALRAREQGLLRTSQWAGVAVDALQAAMLPAAVLTALLVYDAGHRGAPPSATQAFAAVTWLTYIAGPLAAFGTLLRTATTSSVGLARVRAFLALPEAPMQHLPDWAEVREEEEQQQQLQQQQQQQQQQKEGPLASAALLAVEAHLRSGSSSAASAPLAPPAPAPALPLSTTPLLTFSRLCAPVHTGPYSLLPGQLGVWRGPTGCGKSRLLSILAGEAPRDPGAQLTLQARCMYLPQAPWLQAGSVRENIAGLLWEAWGAGAVDEAWYGQVLRACCLEEDACSGALPAGDATECGDGGRGLSGGQRMRVALARAVFCGAAPGLPPTLFLLDDPLAGVADAMGRRVFSSCLQGLLLQRGHAVVMATHSSSFRGQADLELGVGGGEGIEAAQQQQPHQQQEEGQQPAAAAAAAPLPAGASPAPPPPKPRPPRGPDTQVLPSLTHLLHYCSAMGARHGLLLLALFAAAQALTVAQSLWLRAWVSGAPSPLPSLLPPPAASGASLYGALGAASTAAYASALFLLTVCTLHASGVMHSRALGGVLGAPLPALEALPICAVLQRFETDVDHLDGWIRPNALYVLNALAALAGTAALLCWASPPVLAPLAALCGGYYAMLAVYRRGVMPLRALEAGSSSGLVGLWREVAGGGGPGVLRCSGPRAGAAAARQLLRAQEAPMRAALASAAGAELAANALFCLGACILLAAAVGAVALTARAGMHPADAGLLLSACYAFPSALKDLVINLGWLEMSAVSCARLAEYAGMQGEDEAQGKALGRRKGGGGGTPASPAGLVVTDLWVARGGALRAVEGSSSSSSEEQQLQVPLLQEGPLPEWVFQGLTLSIPPGAKVAVLGPSGSGKSTLFKVLLRLWTHSQGSLVLGGVALGALATAAQVRRLVAVLPQGGLLFSGSVAENLLGSSCPPAQEARALAVCQGVSAQLQARILASGGLGGQLHPAQWSTGEAVLLSLARLVLQQGSAAPASLLLLDELSSEVDAQLVQQLMAVLLARPETVLAIEHREAGVRAGGGFTHVLLVGPGAGPQGAVLQSMHEYRAQL